MVFHPELLRIPGDAPGIEAAKSHVLRAGHVQERVRVVNRSREEGVIHVAPVRVIDALLGAPERREAVSALLPGLLLADRLRAEAGTRAPATGPHAVLLDLGASRAAADPARERLVIAVVYREGGMTPAMTCSLTVEPIEDIARLVLYEHRVPEDTPWIAFGSAQVFAACAGLAGWPLEPEWAGVPLKRLRHVAMTACVVLAASGALRATSTAWSVVATEREAAQWRTQARGWQQALADRLILDPRHLALAIGIDPSVEVARARTLWREGVRVSVDADLQRSAYTVTLALTRPSPSAAARAAAPVVVEPERIVSLLALAAPADCALAEPRIRGGLDEVAMVVVCPRPDAGLYGLLPR